MTEYVDAACGYDDNGLPASITQFTFGMMPFSMSENENVEDIMTISKAFQTAAVVEIQVIDNIAAVSFDFAMDTQSLVDFVNELNFYREQILHVTETVSDYQMQLEVAQRNEDEAAIEEITLKLRALSIPFMLPTIVPSVFGGTVHVGFEADPKYIFYTSDVLNQMPTKVVMIFESSQIFAQDEIAIYSMDAEEEIRMQQEEMFLMDEARRAEEEAYRAQYGGYTQDYYAEEDKYAGDGRMKGVRITRNK